RASVAPRRRPRRRRDGRIALEARGTLRPDARAAQAAPGADGGVDRTGPGPNQDARGLRGSRAHPRARGTEAADRDAPPGEGGHPETRGGARRYGDDLSEHLAHAEGGVEGPRDVPPRSDFGV